MASFMLSVSVVYRLKIVDKDSQDLRTSTRSGQKVSYNVKLLFTATVGQDSHGPGLFEEKKKGRVFGSSLAHVGALYHKL